jgi:hypothetical protein
MPGTLERNGITNELALAVNPSLVVVRVSTYGQYGKEDYLCRPGYDAIAQAFGGMMNLTGDPAGPPQRAKTLSVADEMSGFGSRRSVRFLEGFQTGGSGCSPRYGWHGMWRHWSGIGVGG